LLAAADANNLMLRHRVIEIAGTYRARFLEIERRF